MKHESSFNGNKTSQNTKWDSLTDNSSIPNHQKSTPGESSKNLSLAEARVPSSVETSKAPTNLEAFSIQNQRAILESLPSPTDSPEGIENVTKEILKNKSESRILAWVSDENPYRLDQLTPKNLEDFVTKYPTPADFQSLSDSFITMIKTYAGEKSIQKYETAMTNLKNKVYGLKQVYYDQMQAVNTLLKQQNIPPEQQVDPFKNSIPLSEYNSSLDVSDSSPEQLSRQDYESLHQYQTERNLEWEPGVARVAQVARAQVAANELDPQHPSETCQDAYLLRPDSGLFGVFDGAGGHTGGREASHAVAKSVNQACDKYEFVSGSNLAYVLNEANSSVIAATNGKGYTTATLAKIIEQTDGQKSLAYAQVGDSRLYIVHADGTTEQITKDEGEGNILYNALGHDVKYPTKQYGEVPVASGDRIVLWSDGITGDRGNDLMSPEEVGRIVASSRTPEEASTNLVTSARKEDDRTALVFGI